jgi:hypothetical protein
LCLVLVISTNGLGRRMDLVEEPADEALGLSALRILGE